MRRGRIILATCVTLMTFGRASAQELEWAPTALADTSLHVRSLYASVEGTILVGTNIGLLRSDDGGSDWDIVGPVNVNDFEELSPGVLVAVGHEGVHRSTDGGRSWTQVRPKPLADECEDFLLKYSFIVRSPEGELFTGLVEEDGGSAGCKLEGSIYRSENQGLNWSKKGPASSDSQTGLAADDRTFLYGSAMGYIWAVNFTGGTLGGNFVAELEAPVVVLKATSESTLFAGTGQMMDAWVGTGRGMYRSTDGGQAWQQINSGLTDTTITDLVVHEGGTLLASTLGGGVHVSTDHGESWHPVNIGLPSLQVTALAVTADGFVYAGTDRGIYRSTNAIATNAESSGDLPDNFTLFQNYPNPFNPRTVIPFELTSSSHVRLAIYDLLGREVAVLVDGFRQAGRHEVSFDAARLPSGVYQYRIEAESGRQARSMVLFR